MDIRQATRQSRFTSTPNFRQSLFSALEVTTKRITFRSALGARGESGAQPKNWCRGFTIIEMIVSLALFAVVVTVSVGALLMLIGTNDDLQGEQSVMTNLSFALDSMSREIRTGSYYYCDTASSITSASNLDDTGTSTNDCVEGDEGISFKEAGNSITGSSASRIGFYFDSDTGQIFRRVGSGAPLSMVSSGIYVREAGFFVTGSDPIRATNDAVQPTVTIYIEAVDVDDVNEKSYYVQTTVTQRALDI
jgi:prepilin-type N-terminal cleavage/methylation domain-containing protein